MATTKTIAEILSMFQSELKAPKNQRNNFGKYNYRSSEDILEGLKPLIKETKCAVCLSDEIVMVGNRIYVKAKATLNYGDKSIFVEAFAREPEQQKGMSDPQITGSASSYARKYALNGLFAIDDTKDSDHDSQHDTQVVSNGLISEKQHQELRALIQDKGLDYMAVCEGWNFKNLSELQEASIVNFRDWVNSQ